MADATYQTKVYLKQGGEEHVIASGGTQTVESGGKVEIESGGEIEGQSGGKMDLQDGFLFYLNDTSTTGINVLKYVIYSEITLTNYVSTVSVLTVSVFTPGYGHCYFSLAAGCSKCSINLPTASAGMTLTLYMSGCESNVGVSLKAQSAGGASCVNLSGVVVSSINFKKSNTAVSTIILKCFTDGYWTVLDVGNEATVNYTA